VTLVPWKSEIIDTSDLEPAKVAERVLAWISGHQLTSPQMPQK